MEYSEVNITCRTSGGNPLDPGNYIYNWMYKPMYSASTAYIPMPSGKFYTDAYGDSDSLKLITS